MDNEMKYFDSLKLILDKLSVSSEYTQNEVQLINKILPALTELMIYTDEKAIPKIESICKIFDNYIENNNHTLLFGAKSCMIIAQEELEHIKNKLDDILADCEDIYEEHSNSIK